MFARYAYLFHLSPFSQALAVDVRVDILFLKVRVWLFDLPLTFLYNNTIMHGHSLDSVRFLLLSYRFTVPPFRTERLASRHGAQGGHPDSAAAERRAPLDCCHHYGLLFNPNRHGGLHHLALT